MGGVLERLQRMIDENEHDGGPRGLLGLLSACVREGGRAARGEVGRLGLESIGQVCVGRRKDNKGLHRSLAS